MQLPLSWPSLHLSEQYCLRGELPFFPRVPHRSGALEARGRGVTLGPSPGERKREREREREREKEREREGESERERERQLCVAWACDAGLEKGGIAPPIEP